MQNTSVNRVECGDASLASQRPRTFPLTHVTRKFVASSTSENQKRAEWQVMQLSNTCFWNVLESLNWSIPRNPQFLITYSIQQFGHSLLLNTSPVTTTPQPRRVTSVYTLHGLRGGGASDHWLQSISRLTHLRRRDRWTSERTFERYVQQGTFLLHLTGSPKKLQTVSVLSLSSRLVSLQDKTADESRHQSPQPPRLQRRG